MKNMPITVFLLLAAATLAFSPSSAGEPAGAVPPDFTAGGKKDDSHDWLLGPTGLRGWMFFRHEDLTAASRQILVTAVDKGSPADGIVQVNDVILGVFGKPFADDARRSFGHAIAAAEEKTGILPLTIWRDGKSSNVELKLQVLGAYSATAPYDCPKSKAIFEQGCRLIAEKGFENADIPDHLNALALLASGDEEVPLHPRQVCQESRGIRATRGHLELVYRLRESLPQRIHPRHRQEDGLLRTETNHPAWREKPMHERHVGSRSTPGRRPFRRLWRHECDRPAHDHLTRARPPGRRQRSGLGQGHRQVGEVSPLLCGQGGHPLRRPSGLGNAHDDNGKSSCAAVLFDLLDDREATSFNSWMATAAYDCREQGHCGNFWNMLWAIPGASRSGPLATGAYLKEQAWYYDLSRNWKGGFVYQKIEAGDENDNYTDWDLTGGYLLSFGLYQKSLYILGKKPSAAPALDAKAVKKVIAAGRDRFPLGERNGYYKRHDEELIEGLKSWSPTVRYHSAVAIGKRGGDFAPTLIAMLDGKERYARYGAAEALGRLGKGAASALPRLRAALKDPDTWLQCLAAEALTRLGDKDSLGDLFAMSLRPTPADPRRMHQRAASRALFSPYPGNSEPRSILSDSLDGVDRKQLHQVMKVVPPERRQRRPRLHHSSARKTQRPRTRPAPARHRQRHRNPRAQQRNVGRRHPAGRTGYPLAPPHSRGHGPLRFHHRVAVGTDVSEADGIPLPLRQERQRSPSSEIVATREERTAAKPKAATENLNKAIAAIEASTDEPKLVSLKDFIANAAKSNP